MSYRGTQKESRDLYLKNYDVAEAMKYDSWVSSLTAADHDACLADMREHVSFFDDMSVLDVGSGTGALCLALVRIPRIRIQALEPSEAMIDLLRRKPELHQVETKRGFCDSNVDVSIFDAESFDLIVSRLLTNCLYDPLAAFRNWHNWLRKGGSIVVMDGLFDRSAWSGVWEGVVDALPLSACQTIATIPYLLEQTGFRIEHAGMMNHTNVMPSTRTRRFMVVATKND